MIELICKVISIALDFFVKDLARKEAWKKAILERLRELDSNTKDLQKQHQDYEDAQAELKKQWEDKK